MGKGEHKTGLKELKPASGMRIMALMIRALGMVCRYVHKQGNAVSAVCMERSV